MECSCETDTDCEGDAVATTRAGSDGSFSADVWAEKTTTTWYATVTDSRARVSACSEGSGYVHHPCDVAPPGYTHVWTGASNDQWSEAANWEPEEVPGQSSDVFICGSVSPQPRLLAPAETKDLHLAGAAVDLGAHELNVYGALRGGGAAVGTGRIMARGPSIEGCGYPELWVMHPDMSLSGNLEVDRMLQVRPGMRLSVGPHRLEAENLGVENSNVSGDGLVMAHPESLVVVRSAATFGVDCGSLEATSEGNLSDGTMHVRGNLRTERCDDTSSVKQLVSTGTKVVFDGTELQRLAFDDPGPSLSRLDDVVVAGSAVVELKGPTYVSGDVDLHGRLDGEMGADTVAGTLTLRSTSTLTNTHGTFSVGGCSKESGHTIAGTDPCQ